MSLWYKGQKCPLLNELKEMKIEIKRETSEVFFSAIDIGEVFYYDIDDKI